MMTTRRSFLGFLAAAPMIVRAGALMPVKALLDAGSADLVFDGPHPPGGYVYLPSELDATFDMLAAMRAGLRRYQFAYSNIPPQWGKVFDAEKGAA